MVDYIMARPEFDPATEYSFWKAQAIIDYLIAQNLPHLDIQKDEAVKANCEPPLKQYPKAMWIHYDHGSDAMVVGQDRKAIINLDNVELLAGREAYNLNCSSGLKLGPAAKDIGCLAYWGYAVIVSFTEDALDEFKEAFNYGWFLRVRDGKSWKQCLEETKEHVLGDGGMVDKLIEDGKIAAATSMQRDFEALVCYNGGSDTPSTKCPIRAFVVGLFKRLFGVRGVKWAWRLPGLSSFQ